MVTSGPARETLEVMWQACCMLFSHFHMCPLGIAWEYHGLVVKTRGNPMTNIGNIIEIYHSH